MSKTKARAQDSPHPDDSRKPDSPDEIEKPTAKYMVKRAVKEFSKDQVTDIAAGLVYFSVLALFPGLIAIVSLLGLFGQSQAVSDGITEIVSTLAPDPGMAESINGFVTSFLSNQSTGGASLGVVVGLLGALYSASKYVGAFSRAMNRIYEVDEGRPVWKLKPIQFLLTLGAVVLIAISLLILVISGPVAQAVGDVVGLGSTAVTVWQIAKWPVLLLIVVLLVAVLYWATPNIQQPKFRWMSMGALVAIVVWLLASVAFALYVVNFGSYNATYGALGGAVIFLLWLWITNIALLLGAEIDAEIERGRELQAGMPAEEHVQLPPRDTTASDKKDKKMQETIDEGRRLREENSEGSGEGQSGQQGRGSSDSASGSGSHRSSR
ncbi:YihY/virulence factor BrkB family protein [uncultured Pseudokineococcus sp.]|uniref:YihY/virulence factor BrkB family protein n=1 Tax=uncultured Pseudokineococcus sp. TaxID=1642928 RepID=UPI002616078B|nr:YihY/virulence factor BrkB family protein [uncultured Pseudokineococcus sp.]